MLHHVAWCGRRHNAPQGCSLRLAAAAAPMSVKPQALSQRLPVSVSHFRIYVVDKGVVVQDTERLRLAGFYLIYRWVYVSTKCYENAADHVRLQPCCGAANLNNTSVPSKDWLLGKGFIAQHSSSGKWKRTGLVLLFGFFCYKSCTASKHSFAARRKPKVCCDLWQRGTFFFFNWDKLYLWDNRTEYHFWRVLYIILT